MNKIFPLALICLSTLVFSCSDEGDDTPPPDPCNSLLSPGWALDSINGAGQFNDIFFQNNSSGLAIGNSLYKTNDGGVTWANIRPDDAIGINAFITPNGNFFIPRGLAGFMFSGSMNNNIFADGNLRVYDVSFVDDNNGFAFANNFSTYSLYYTNNGGAAWTRVNHSILSSGSNPYGTLDFANAQKGWIAQGRRIFQVNNNSITDSVDLAFNPAPSTPSISAVQALSASVVLVSYNNGEIFKSVNGGISFNRIAFFDMPDAFTDIHFFNEQTGYASSAGKIFKTIDGGTSWQLVVVLCNDFIAEIHFTDLTHGWAATGNGRILRFRP